MIIPVSTPYSLCHSSKKLCPAFFGHEKYGLSLSNKLSYFTEHLDRLNSKKLQSSESNDNAYAADDDLLEEGISYSSR